MVPELRIPAARVLVTVAAVSVLAGCATKGDLRDLQTEIRTLAVRQDSLIAELRRETLSTQDTLRETTDQLFSFRGDISRQLREIARSLSELEALVGENQRGIIGVRDQLANLRRTPAGPAGGGPVSGGPGVGGDPMGGGEPGAGGAQAGGPEELYNSAVGQRNRGSVATARLAFQQFLEAYPNHELAPDAHYALADLMVQENRLEDALAAFQEIPELFPTAERVPEALYRVALIQIELGDEEEAEATLERILNSYPDAGGVTLLAQEKLDEIR